MTVCEDKTCKRPEWLMKGKKKTSPVAFSKLRLKKADSVSGASVFLFQRVKAIDHCDTNPAPPVSATALKAFLLQHRDEEH